jgi:hypothetical protein
MLDWSAEEKDPIINCHQQPRVSISCPCGNAAPTDVDTDMSWELEGVEFL